MSDKLWFDISFPTDEGFFGRECNNPGCKKYFRVYIDSFETDLFCPYCGTKFSGSELWTPEQQRYAQQVAEEKAKEYMLGELDKMFGNLARSTRGNKYFTLKHTPKNYRARNIMPNYSEKKVDTELVCPECQFRFQVLGIFGFCPNCKTENIKIYDANLTIILKEIKENQDPNRALRHAYNDLVATFEHFCQRKAASFTEESARFQVLKEARDFFKKRIGKDMYDGISADDQKEIRRVFLKRHLYEHNGGIVNAKYIQQMPEDHKYLGNLAPLSEEEFKNAAGILRRIISNLI